MRYSGKNHQWLLAGTGLLLLGLVALSCGSDSSDNAGSNCSLARSACQFGCSADLGCVECTTNAQCGAGAPICVLGRCEACGVNTDCGTGQVCSPATHQCTAGCQTSANCVGNGQGNNAAPICDAALGACVGCTTDADCTGTPRPVCDPTRRQCSECASRANCGVATPACNLQNGNCEECLIDADCGITQACGQNHQCRDLCTSDASCANDPAGPVCNPAGACVQCALAKDCTNAATPVCSEQNRCVACSVNADCPAATPICEANARAVGGLLGASRCVECTASQPCTDPTKSICSPQGLCLQCNANRDCTNAATPVCGNQGICVAAG